MPAKPYRSYSVDQLLTLSQMADHSQEMAMSNLRTLSDWALTDDSLGLEGDRRIVSTLATIGGMLAHLQNQNSMILDLLLEITISTRPSDQNAAEETHDR